MVRFQKTSRRKPVFTIILSAAVFAMIIALFLSGISIFTQGSVERQKKILSTSLNRIITFCYANEGSYPESLDYIIENYGLTYDDSTFYIDYNVLGSNIYPDVTIIEKSGGNRAES